MNGQKYALLVSIGNYTKWNLPDLPTYDKDLSLIKEGLCEGLGFVPDNIRIIGDTGNVTAKEKVKTL